MDCYGPFFQIFMDYSGLFFPEYIWTVSVRLIQIIYGLLGSVHQDYL